MKSDLKFQFAMLLFVIAVLAMTSTALQQPQRISNYAKEPTVSEQSAQISQFAPSHTDPAPPLNIKSAAINFATAVNNTTSSFIQTIFGYLVAGVLFVGIFFILIKKFLKV